MNMLPCVRWSFSRTGADFQLFRAPYDPFHARGLTFCRSVRQTAYFTHGSGVIEWRSESGTRILHVNKIQNPNSLRITRTIADTPAADLSLRHTSSAMKCAFIVARHLRCTSPVTFRVGITVISISFAILRGFFTRVGPLICINHIRKALSVANPCLK
jgi:hypothetical protein